MTNNNRLMFYTETVDSELRRTVYYTYYETGDVSNITIKDETSPNTRADLALTYARNGGLWLAVWRDYDVDATTQEYVADSYVPALAREFRYESGRGRYMSRDYTTNGETNPGLWEPATAWTYTEYVGDTPIADWEVDLDSGDADEDGTTDEPVWTKLRTYLPGSSAGDAAGAQKNADDSIQYYHGDLVGSTVGTTDADGTNGVFDGPAITVAYTAFGEIVTRDGNGVVSIGSGAPNGYPRYQYCGNWGYESGHLSLSGHDETLPPIALMHVGARWYDPALGRFVQRDSMGVSGGLNVYAYALNCPHNVDPAGYQTFPPVPGTTSADWDWAWHQPRPRPPWVPEPLPPPRVRDMQPLKELELLKRRYYWDKALGTIEGAIIGGIIGGGGGPVGAIVGAVVGAGGVLIPEFIDDACHRNEPLNPLLGGDYSNW
ncbi:MAG: hypothetical protein CHACPFDD_02800 [Phycisphaerae bacterium]|nr:hypothetical protein [Phycisphaerae bacterium]